MRIIPVLDLRSGLAVHAIGGQRRHYGRLRSVWAPGSSDPRVLVKAYSEKYQFDTPLELYLADLDAIERTAAPDLTLYAELASRGIRLWVDAGASRATDLAPWFDAGVAVAVLGLETLEGPEQLAEAVDRWGPSRLIFSLDLNHGSPLRDTQRAWGTTDPFLLGTIAWSTGLTSLLLLDLARVGTGLGVGTLDLLQRLSGERAPEAELFVGGGVRAKEDLAPPRRAGATGALVGTALHQGRIEPRDLEDWPPEA